MEAGNDAVLDARQLRKQRLLAKGQERLSKIQSGGPPSASRPSYGNAPVLDVQSSIASRRTDSNNTATISRDLTTPDVKAKASRAIESPGSSIAELCSSVSGGDTTGSKALYASFSNEGGQVALQPTRSAALQPVSSPLPALLSGSDGDSDIDLTANATSEAASGSVERTSEVTVHLQPVAVDQSQSGVDTRPSNDMLNSTSNSSNETGICQPKAMSAFPDQTQSKQAMCDRSIDEPKVLPSCSKALRRAAAAIPAAAVAVAAAEPALSHSKPSVWADRTRRAAAGTAGIRTLTAGALAVLTVAAREQDREGSSASWSVVSQELDRLPPLFMLLATNLVLILAGCVNWGVRETYVRECEEDCSAAGYMAFFQKVLMTAVPRLYTAAITIMPVAGALWDDVLVLAFAGAAATLFLGPNLADQRAWADSLSLNPLHRIPGLKTA